MAKKYSKRMTRQRKAILESQVEEMVEKLEFVLRSLCGQIEELAELQHHRRWCIDNVLLQTPELQHTFDSRGFNILSTFYYMVDCRKIYDQIDIDPDDLIKLHATIVRNLSKIDGAVSEEINNLLQYNKLYNILY